MRLIERVMTLTPACVVVGPSPTVVSHSAFFSRREVSVFSMGQVSVLEQSAQRRENPNYMP